MRLPELDLAIARGESALAAHQCRVLGAQALSGETVTSTITDLLHLAASCGLDLDSIVNLAKQRQRDEYRQVKAARQHGALLQLDRALQEATLSGLFDAIECDHPDTINKFCDRITEEVRRAN